jgi:hypothetical protein
VIRQADIGPPSDEFERQAGIGQRRKVQQFALFPGHGFHGRTAEEHCQLMFQHHGPGIGPIDLPAARFHELLLPEHVRRTDFSAPEAQCNQLLHLPVRFELLG